MNAAEQATTLESTTKIASIVNLFKTEFPDARADLRPWHSDPDTQRLIDPDSIDIGFHLPGWSPRYECRSILVQVRLHLDAELQTRQLIGLEVVGFSYEGEQWRLSTIDQWNFVGAKRPDQDIRARFKHFCHQVFRLFQKAGGDTDSLRAAS